jgi:hypothetical protein
MFAGLRGLDGPSVAEQKPGLATDCGHLAMANPTCTGSGENQRFCNNREKTMECKPAVLGLPNRTAAVPLWSAGRQGEKFFPRCETVLVLCCFREIVIDTFVVCVCLSGLQSWLSD